jgi:hypothetical protein|tara:strand:+ start:144 stop:332 length:189 start_codon:yes stop_codon:yes gene_type:complete
VYRITFCRAGAVERLAFSLNTTSVIRYAMPPQLQEMKSFRRMPTRRARQETGHQNYVRTRNK